MATFEGLCASCSKVAKCKWFVELLRADEQQQRKLGGPKVLSIVYDCPEYQKEACADVAKQKAA